jgi:uncharacterized protein (DUF433 family)
MPAAGVKKSATKTKGRIVCSPGVCGGRPRIAGTRISVDTLLRCREIGFTEARILKGYPALSAADLAAAWAYAARRARAS